MKITLSISALLFGMASALSAQNAGKQLQVLRGDSVLASFPLSSDMTVVVREGSAENLQSSALFASPFPEDDGSKDLTGSEAAKLSSLVRKMDVKRAMILGNTEITDEEFAEIKAFVDENLVGATGNATFRNIFNWIRANIKVPGKTETPYLRPYDVFIYRKCVCQGYANLMKTMMLTQDLPSFVANGFLGTVGGHAWNYCYDGKKWWVCDPTNGGIYLMTDVSKYSAKLIPHHADLTMFEDDLFCYGFDGKLLNINEVKQGAPDELTIPFGVEGYRITLFSPLKSIPQNVTSLTFGQYISSMGEYISMLHDYTPGVAEVSIDPNNRYLSVHEGIVYKGSGNVPYYIPTAIKRVVLKQMKHVDKNIVAFLSEVEEIVVAEGTQTIGAYAFEMLPKLKRVYVPENTVIEENAIYNCGSEWEIIRQSGSTGIRDVKM